MFITCEGDNTQAHYKTYLFKYSVIDKKKSYLLE